VISLKPVTKPDFATIKTKVTESLEDDSIKNLWDSINKWLDQDGESYLRQQLDVLATQVKKEALSSIAKIDTEMPSEE
jgi:hypothetical protein